MKWRYLMLGLFAVLEVCGQETWVLESPALPKPDTVLVFKPRSYTTAKAYPLVYLLHGYSEDYRQWSVITDLQRHADEYEWIIVTPDGFTSYYLNSPVDGPARYEDFFFRELVPKVHRTFRIDTANVFISGLSMGGYGALRYFILHPAYFNTAASTSGALEVDYKLLREASLHFWGTTRLTDDVTRQLGDPAVSDWNRYSIATLLNENPDFRRPFMLDCGTDDLLFPVTERLKAQADRHGIPVTYLTQPGGHDAAYWARSIDYHFAYFRQHLKR